MSVNVELVIVDVTIWYNKDKIQLVIFIEISGWQLINHSKQAFTNINLCDLCRFQSYLKFDLKHDLSCLFILNIKVNFFFFLAAPCGLWGIISLTRGCLGPQ